MKRLSPARYLFVAGLTSILAAVSSVGAQPALAQTGSIDQPESFGSSDFNQYVPANPVEPGPPVGNFGGDEFDGPAGSAPNPAIWKYDVGGDGWGNSEDQTYTDSRENSRLDGNGNLVISARRDGAGQITSARLTTKGTGNFTFGTLEARIKVPAGDGLSAAFWLLGDKVDSIGWPKCGEIDITETINEADFLHNGIHGSTFFGPPHWEQANNRYGLNLSADFHTYGVRKQPGRIEILFDNQIVSTYTRESMPFLGEWVFDAPMYAVLNIAVGGVWPGPVTDKTPNPAEMIVDWVRVSA